MNENRTIHFVEIPIGGKGGFVWNRLHGEREDICEALLKNLESTSEAYQLQECLHARLRRIDDALDRLMAGSYGICSKCGSSIENTTLEVDPAWSHCLDCSGGELSAGRIPENENAPRDVESPSEIVLDRLKSFDTILVHTNNSDYRILLLDPKTGRALVESNNYLPEPSEGLVKGSATPGSAFSAGAICVGCRLELWVGGKVLLTSPIKSFEVKHNAPAESVESLSAAIALPQESYITGGNGHQYHLR